MAVRDRRQSDPARAVEELAAFASGLDYEVLPDRTVEFTKALVSKVIAANVVGSRTASARSFAAIINERCLPPEAGVVGFGFMTSLWEAVLTNAFTAHTSELEDVGHSAGGVSWDITVIPLALSLGEKLRLSGRSIIEMVVAGLEVHYRTCLPFDATSVGMVLPPTAAMGCAAAAAKAYGLSPAETASAMAMSLSSAPMAEESMGTDAHFLESAMHAMQGVMSADMARAGLTGSQGLTAFERLRVPSVTLDDVTAGLLDRWYLEEIWVKKYPLCFLVHRQVDAILDICADNALAEGEIARIDVFTGPGDASCDRPHPRTIGDMQFSFQHALAVAMVTGEIGLTSVQADALNDCRFAEARKKVHVHIDPTMRYSVSLSEPTTVAVKTTDGRELVEERLTAKGSPDDPLTRDEFTSLYRRLVRGALTPTAVERTLDAIWRLDEIDNFSEIMTVLTACGEGR